jgi:tetratricopeptide (TPR) repeat protein
MGERTYRRLVNLAIALTIAWFGWSIYDGFVRGVEPGDNTYLAGNNYFEDGRYAQALKAYEEALADYRAALHDPAGELHQADGQPLPEHIHALRGKARALLMLGRLEESLAAYDRAIALAPDFAGTYANRGILHDRMGHHQQALADYDKALSMAPRLAEGPDWLTRFLRLQPERPPSIADRAAYLRAELAKPATERVLSIPERNAAQRPYEM